MCKVESSVIKGRGISIGEDSPLKHGTTVGCEINNNNSTIAYHDETLDDGYVCLIFEVGIVIF